MTTNGQEVDWRVRAQAVSADPLFAGAATAKGLEGGKDAPRAVYMGIGLCTRHRLAVGLPMDVLGMLLPAERLRVALGAEHLVVLIADAHAMSNGFSLSEVAHRASSVARALLRIRSVLGWQHLRLLRASRLQEEVGYQATLERIRSLAGAEQPGVGNEYMFRQTADVAYLHEALGGLLKLGWTVDVDGEAGGYRDEVAFDRLVAPWSGAHPSFAYVRCGRALDDRRPKVSPYVGVERARRLYLDPQEGVDAKLARARQLASARNVSATREHLGRIAEAWGVRSGPLELRLKIMLRELFPSRRIASLTRSSSHTRGGLAVARPRGAD